MYVKHAWLSQPYNNYVYLKASIKNLKTKTYYHFLSIYDYTSIYMYMWILVVVVFFRERKRETNLDLFEIQEEHHNEQKQKKKRNLKIIWKLQKKLLTHTQACMHIWFMIQILEYWRKTQNDFGLNAKCVSFLLLFYLLGFSEICHCHVTLFLLEGNLDLHFVYEFML